MSYPSPPEISTSYTSVEQALGNGTLPGQELDVDFAATRSSIEALIAFVKGITRSDGKLANGIVTTESLSSALIIGFDPPALWQAGVAYTTSSTVFSGYGFYLCVAAHTSTVFNDDLASGRWSLLADLTPPGGALVASNNLSDVADASVARANLGLGTMATAAATAYRTNVENDLVYQPILSGLTASAAELNILDGVTATAAELNHVDGVTSAIQTQLNGKQASSANLSQLAAPVYARGDLIRRGAASLERLTPTAAGQVPMFDGTDAVWAAPPGTYTMVGPVATTSGTSVNLSTAISTSAREIHVSLENVSTNGNGAVGIQVGNASFLTTGYVGDAGMASDGWLAFSSRFVLSAVFAASGAYTGHATLTKMSATRWSYRAVMGRGTSNVLHVGAGYIDVTGGIDRLRLNGGGDTFDTGDGYVSWVI